MSKKILFLLAALFLTFALAIPTLAGGWAVITLDRLPGEIRAGEVTRFDFTIRQHGVTLVSGHSATVYATNVESGQKLSAAAFDTDPDGHYAAELSPSAGAWEWGISWYGGEEEGQTMPTLTVLPATAGAVDASEDRAASGSLRLAAGIVGAITAVAGGFVFVSRRSRWAGVAALVGIGLAAFGFPAEFAQTALAESERPGAVEEVDAPVEMTQVEMGQALFLAKGCVVCHVHSEVRPAFEGHAMDIGPNLSATVLPVEYLLVWLKDPLAVKPETTMPNLELSEVEIEALAAFLVKNQ